MLLTSIGPILSATNHQAQQDVLADAASPWHACGQRADGQNRRAPGTRGVGSQSRRRDKEAWPRAPQIAQPTARKQPVQQKAAQSASPRGSPQPSQSKGQPTTVATIWTPSSSKSSRASYKSSKTRRRGTTRRRRRGSAASRPRSPRSPRRAPRWTRASWKRRAPWSSPRPRRRCCPRRRRPTCRRPRLTWKK